MGMGNPDNRLLILLNLAKVLGAKEMRRIQSISAGVTGEVIES